jgi:hypothetical protein
MVGAERRDVPDPNKAKKRFDGERPGEDFGSNGELDCDRSAGMKGSIHVSAVGRAHVRNGEDYETATWSYIDHSGRAVFTYSDKPK